jgi:hypothetical protein
MCGIKFSPVLFKRSFQLSVLQTERPQQEPGPSQPDLGGDCPQQAVSPGPGKLCPGTPDNELGADISFSVSSAPQKGQG